MRGHASGDGSELREYPRQADREHNSTGVCVPVSVFIAAARAALLLVVATES